MLIINHPFLSLLIQSLRYFLRWLIFVTALLFLGELILPGWVSAQVNFFALFLVLLLALLIEIAGTRIVGTRFLKNNSQPSFWTKIGVNFLLASAIISVLMFQIAWWLIILIILFALLIAKALFYKS